MNKNRHIIGELQDFFVNSDSSKAINSISAIMNSIRILSFVFTDLSLAVKMVIIWMVLRDLV